MPPPPTRPTPPEPLHYSAQLGAPSTEIQLQLYQTVHKIGVSCFVVALPCLATLILAGPFALPHFIAPSALTIAEEIFPHVIFLLLIATFWTCTAASGLLYWICAEHIANGSTLAAFIALLFTAAILGILLLYFYLFIQAACQIPHQINTLEIFCLLFALLFVWAIGHLFWDLFAFLRSRSPRKN